MLPIIAYCCSLLFEMYLGCHSVYHRVVLLAFILNPFLGVYFLHYAVRDVPTVGHHGIYQSSHPFSSFSLESFFLG